MKCALCNLVIYQREGLYMDCCRECNKPVDELTEVKSLAIYSKIDESVDRAWEINR